MAMAQTALVSFECCQVARGMSLSAGLGLRKCVMICLVLSLNNVACGPNNVQAKLEPEGKQIYCWVPTAWPTRKSLLPADTSKLSGTEGDTKSRLASAGCGAAVRTLVST